jgi:hypothetical protein
LRLDLNIWQDEEKEKKTIYQEMGGNWKRNEDIWHENDGGERSNNDSDVDDQKVEIKIQTDKDVQN